ncbi:MAG: hypothetical protein CBC38_06165 [Gammaproteobacteria bacterium TMED78]|nr:MAG: hypothetical protein CBC38_06165 [Gammaproteobacteria bacterium TMED78]|tara:strand:- start:9005 stop:10435 length:1431 start_codon:yes stop_codon:yes gene_type:complete
MTKKILFLFLFIAFPVFCNSQEASSPNILFIAIDDLNDWVGPLGGNDQVKTPNIDALASRGITFTNAHTPASLCNPARTAIFSGLAPSSTGVYLNNPDWRTLEIFDDAPTIPKHLKDNGYTTQGAGKLFHASTYNPRAFKGFNDLNAWDSYYPSIDRQLPDEVAPINRPANQTPMSRFFDWHRMATEDEATGDGQIVTHSINNILNMDDNNSFIGVGIYRPHLPWYNAPEYFDLYPLDQIQLPLVNDSDLDDIPTAGKISSSNSFDPIALHQWVLQSGTWEEAVQAYLASISFADAMVGRLIDALEQSGKSDDTIIVLWSDHGWHLGEKLRWRKQTIWEEATRVPLIIVAPGITEAGTKTDKVVSLMDLYPTLLDLIDFDIPNHLEGRSLRPLIENPDIDWNHFALSTYGYKNHAIRDDRYRYIKYSDGSEELYDHHEDPNEWYNLASDQNYSDIKARLESLLPVSDIPDQNNQLR